MHQSIHVANGRALAYEEFGAAEGRPVLYFHGTPGSRLKVLLLAEEAQRLGLRLIALDRPGCRLRRALQRGFSVRSGHRGAPDPDQPIPARASGR